MSQSSKTTTSIVATTTPCPNTLAATDTEGKVSVGAGTFVGVTGKVQASDNGTDWVDWPSYDVHGAFQDASTTYTLTDSTAAFICRVPSLQGLNSVRFLATGWSSGSAPVTVSSGVFGTNSGLPSVPPGGNGAFSTVTMADAANIAVGTTTGTKIGTGTTQKLGFFNATPIVQPANTVDYLAGLVNLGLRASGGTADAAFPGGITSSKATGTGIGYATGAGGTVSQATDRTTGVTINKLCGQITTQATSLAAAALVSFTVTNSTVAIGDVVNVVIQSGPTTVGTIAYVTTVAAGSFQITLKNLHASTADTGAAILNFAVQKAVSA